MDALFVQSIRTRARARRARIGIGIKGSDNAILAGLQEAGQYAELVAVGNACCGADMEFIETPEPEEELVRLLVSGEIDGAVRGNVSASKVMRAVAATFGVRVMRMVLIDLNGWAFFLGPVGIAEGDTAADRLDLAVRGAELIRALGVEPSVAILSAGRMEDRGRSERVDWSLDEGELIAKQARDAGINARHPGILIEGCRGDDLIVAPDGISGNLIFRTMMFLCGAESLGAPVLMREAVFIDSSRARGEFTGPVALASAMVGWREKEGCV